MKPTVSIIVPVYNGEATVGRCIESILSQEYQDYELLLVDDGSKDASGAICDAYAAKDSRIQVLHKENSGVSDSRNQALDRARGTWVEFLDCDDWITPDATASLVQAAEAHSCDLVIADFYRVVGERVSQKGDIEEDCVLTREAYAAHMMENPADFYYGVLWNKLYRRAIIEEHHLRMDPEISWCEDFLFNLEYIRHAQRFYALQVPIYYYVKTKGSLANQNVSLSKTVKMKLMMFDYYQQFYKSVLDEDEYERSRLKVYRFLVDAAGDGLVPPTLLPGSQKLGSERMQVDSGLLGASGPLADAYRERKLLEHYLETAALKNTLTLQEAEALLILSSLPGPVTRQEAADFAGLSRRTLSLLVQRLSGKGLLRTEELREPEAPQKRLRFLFPPAAEPVLTDLRAAQALYESARTARLSAEELAQYAALHTQIQDRIRAVLS